MQNTKRMIENQLSIFSLNVCNTVTGPTTVAVPSENSLADYLYKGERIFSMLRKKTERVNFSKCDFLERFNINSYVKKKKEGVEAEYVEQIALNQARHLWELDDNSDASTNELLKFISKYLLVEATNVPNEGKSEIKDILNYFFRKSKNKPKGIISVRSYISDYDFEIPAGEGSKLSASKHMRVYRLRRTGTKFFKVADAGMLFKKAFLVCTLKEQVQKAVNGLSEQELEECILYRFITEKMAAIAPIRANENSGNAKVFVSEFCSQKKFIREAMERFPQAQYITLDGESYVGAGMNFFLWSWLLSCHDEDKIPFEAVSDIGINQLCELLEKVCDVYTMEKQSHELLHELGRESAKVYETKKNISLKCKNAMKCSRFNDYFGYVEIDDECDLDKFHVVEKQFIALSTLVFHEKKSMEVSIRFRKLGRHHAAGLYFPELKCMAVDVRNTDSFAHEYFHMLDYERDTKKSFSSEYKFSAIRYQYRDCLLREIEKSENEILKKQLNGNTKYNLSYYLTPTEIFARCGELYLTKVLGVNNSLVKPDETIGFAYPDDSLLIEQIKEYFDEFLRKMEL